MNATKRIPDNEWKVIVEHVPIVSVDLIIKHDDGILLGKRQNKPAKGEWFVPGGRVKKNEQLTDAVQRIARGEIGCDVEIRRSLGAFEHFYDSSDVAETGTKHYLANGYVVVPNEEPAVADNQHEEMKVFLEPYPDFHDYVEQYIEQLK